jgi:hypothetical protein
MRLFKRHVALEVDTIKVSPDLRIRFRSTKTYKPEPNTAEVKIYNLSPEHRAQLSKIKSPILKLAAGYGAGDEGLTQLFYGTAIYVKHEIEGADIITTVSTTDGGEQKQTARVNLTFGPNTKTGTVLKRIAATLGLKPGNVDKIARQIDASAKAEIYSQGCAPCGSSAAELGHLLRSCGYEWSIQDQTIAIRKIGTASEGFAVELSPETGLIESPSISNKGVCSGTCLLFKAGAGLDLVPGRLIRIASEFVSGQFVLAKTESIGDNYADDWYCNFQAVTRKGEFAKVS